MKKIGLALSGGGFRASLYHLGLMRFLRDAGILPQVTHITSVSGGSVIAAHLALNWDRYTGSPNDFDAVASELLAFVGLDIRNRITRRFPLSFVVRWPRRLLGRSNRKLTRTGLLEYHYEKYLYGDTSLFQLPEWPQLHILATNVSEGCLCSFNRDGLWMMRRQPGHTVRVDRIHIGLATVPMAVTASSAFPGFFPPLVLTGQDVGARGGEFGRQAYTDGGIFDNLGVRMFHCLERPILSESPLCRDDFVDFEASVKALLEASRAPEETPLRRLAQLLVVACRQPNLLLLPGGRTSQGANPPPAIETGQPGLPVSPGAWIGDNQEVMLAGLWNLMRHYQFRLDPLFADLKPLEPEAQALLRATRLDGQPLGAGDQVWLNRHLLEAAFRQANGLACFRRLNSGLDGVLVSDVGKRIAVKSDRGGIIRTAMRATDILMDRVWQLESETFEDTPGFVFANITEVVEPKEDATALHPEIQRQTANIRTDLDRFSPLEISSLIRHGYCVGRKACRARPDLFGADLPANAPWDPFPEARRARAASALPSRNGTTHEASAITLEARTLQASAIRRIWSTLLDRRDWVSYVYVPIIIPILCLLPYLAIDAYKRHHRLGQLVHSFAQGTRDLETLNAMLDTKVVPWTGEPAEKVLKLDEPDLKGFDILQDSRIFDLRDWKPSPSGKNGPDSLVLIYRRVKVLKRRENTTNNQFRLVLLPTSPKAQTRFPPQELSAKLLMSEVKSSVPGREECRWEASFDFEDVPPGDFIDLVMEELSPGQYLDRKQSGSGLTFRIQAPTAELTTWILMPRGMEYKNFRISRHQPGKPETAENFRPVTEYLADDFTIIAFKLVGLEAGWEYDVSWLYK